VGTGWLSVPAKGAVVRSTGPSVIVILPAHNAEATIGAAIATTLNQTYTDFELWVLENGSTDRTAEIARSFTDPRVRTFELGPVGFQGAIQYAIENASSEWLARMDADDLMFPDRLKVQMEVLRNHKEFVLVGTAMALLTPFGHIFERYPAPRPPSREVDTATVSRGRFFANPSTIFSRRVALEVGFDEECTRDDISLWFRMLTRGKGWEIAEPLHLYRLQPNTLSRSAEFDRQIRRVREKYAPQTLHQWAPGSPRSSSVWLEVARLELIAGHATLVRQAADSLEQDGFLNDARLFRWRSYLGRPVSLYYRWRNRNTVQRRPDWEELFAPFLDQTA
jgi:glycosyltransferase involved in cell wall biosynthesis